MNRCTMRRSCCPGQIGIEEDRIEQHIAKEISLIERVQVYLKS